MELSRKQLCSSIALWLKYMASKAQKKRNPSTLKPLVNPYILLNCNALFLASVRKTLRLKQKRWSSRKDNILTTSCRYMLEMPL